LRAPSTAGKIAAMKIACLIFDKFTALDVIGPYEVFSRLPGVDFSFVAKETGPKRSDTGVLGLTADRSLAEFPDPDLLLVGGGEGNRPMLTDNEVLDWLRSADAGSTWTTSVCTGALVLGAAGLLDGMRATTHWAYLDQLRQYGAEPVSERYVIDGKLATAAGVSAGLDMALELIGRIAGEDVAKAIQLGIEYDPAPPFDSGAPHKATPELVELIRQYEGVAEPVEASST
jgi:transcriptional regulator GlxA family with amidase domain